MEWDSGVELPVGLRVNAFIFTDNSQQAVLDRHDRAGTYGFWPVILLLTGLWIASIGGPPPPSVAVIAYGNLALLAGFGWGFWIDWHRSARPEIAGD